MLKLFMPISFPIENLKSSAEIIICDGETARHAHKELFHFSDDAYLVAGDKGNFFNAIVDMFNAFNSSQPPPSKMHIVMNWPNLLQVSLWQTSRPAIGDLFTLLKNNGVSSNELQPFKNSDIADIFPWLYYGKKIEVLRKICRTAKRKIENNLKNHIVRIDCHIIADDTKKIIASSL